MFAIIYEIKKRERVDTSEVNIEKNKGYMIDKEIGHPVLGIYIVDTEPCGIYTKVGRLITNK